VVFDGIFSFAGNDDDVLDAGGDALFRHVLNLRLVDDGEHLFRLRLGGGQKSRAKPSGREHRLADFVAAVRGAGSTRRVGCGGGVVGHRLGFLHPLILAHSIGWRPFFDADSNPSMFFAFERARRVASCGVVRCAGALVLALVESREIILAAKDHENPGD